MLNVFGVSESGSDAQEFVIVRQSIRDEQGLEFS